MSGSQADPWAAYPVAPPEPMAAPDDPWASYPVPPTAPNVLQRFGHGVGDVAYGTAQLMAHSIPGVAENGFLGRLGRTLGMGEPATAPQLDARIAQREANYQTGRAAGNQTGTDWARAGGELAGMVPPALLSPVGRTLTGSIAAGAGGGALTSALVPVTNPDRPYWEQKREQVLAGSGLGAVIGPIARVLGRAISPNVDPNVATLRDAGVDMTTGQVSGRTARRFEDSATSLPVGGERILDAQRRSLESFNRAVANRVLEPLGQSVERDAPAGRALVADVQQRVSRAYDDAMERANPFAPDQQFATDMLSAARRFLTPESGRTFLARIQNDVASRAGSGPIDPAIYQDIRSELARLTREYGGSSATSERELGRAFNAAREAFDGLAERANPHIADQLRAANLAYAQLVRMEGAAAAQGAVEGVFSAPQLSAVVRGGDGSVRHRAFAAGEAMMQDLSDAGRRVLPSTVNDSGTATRSQMLNPLAWGAGMAVSPMYRPGMQRAATWLMSHDAPAPVGLLGNTIANSGGALSVPLGSLLLSPPERRPD